jgi:hypothetical protein
MTEKRLLEIGRGVGSHGTRAAKWPEDLPGLIYRDRQLRLEALLAADVHVLETRQRPRNRARTSTAERGAAHVVGP